MNLNLKRMIKKEIEGYRKKPAQKNEFRLLTKAQQLSLKYILKPFRKPRDGWSKIFKSFSSKNKTLLDEDVAAQWDKTDWKWSTFSSSAHPLLQYQ